MGASLHHHGVNLVRITPELSAIGADGGGRLIVAPLVPAYIPRICTHSSPICLLSWLALLPSRSHKVIILPLHGSRLHYPTPRIRLHPHPMDSLWMALEHSTGRATFSPSVLPPDDRARPPRVHPRLLVSLSLFTRKDGRHERFRFVHTVERLTPEKQL